MPACHTRCVEPITNHGRLSGVSARNLARARMVRRRRRTVLIAVLLLLVTAGWMWRGNVGPGARAGPAAGRHPVHPVQAAVGHPSVTPPSAPRATPAPSVSPALAGAGAGRLVVVRGSSRVYGNGPLRRYLVEVEAGLDIGEDTVEFADFVARTLGDPHSWTHGGAISVQRVESGPVAFRVALASPRTVDRYCAPLDTNGYTSCYDGRGRAMLNVLRWASGVPWYVDDLTTYRQYMVNHEVGHALGHHHAYCPRPGAPAPTMQQQTLGMQGCRRNAWPYP